MWSFSVIGIDWTALYVTAIPQTILRNSLSVLLPQLSVFPGKHIRSNKLPLLCPLAHSPLLYLFTYGTYSVLLFPPGYLSCQVPLSSAYFNNDNFYSKSEFSKAGPNNLQLFSRAFANFDVLKSI